MCLCVNIVYDKCMNVKIKVDNVCVFCFLRLPSDHNLIPCPFETVQSIIHIYIHILVRSLIGQTGRTGVNI